MNDEGFVGWLSPVISTVTAWDIWNKWSTFTFAEKSNLGCD